MEGDPSEDYLAVFCLPFHNRFHWTHTKLQVIGKSTTHIMIIYQKCNFLQSGRLLLLFTGDVADSAYNDEVYTTTAYPTQTEPQEGKNPPSSLEEAT